MKLATFAIVLFMTLQAKVLHAEELLEPISAHWLSVGSAPRPESMDVAVKGKLEDKCREKNGKLASHFAPELSIEERNIPNVRIKVAIATGLCIIDTAK
ncbi:MAG: hypothetical protein AB7P04_15410 [Bacteriovoracia bacterium]